MKKQMKKFYKMYLKGEQKMMYDRKRAVKKTKVYKTDEENRGV